MGSVSAVAAFLPARSPKDFAVFVRCATVCCVLFAWLGIATAEPDPSPPLLANGNFEVDANSDGWPDHWPRPKQGIRLATEEQNQFLQLVSSKPGETVMLYHAVKVPKDVRALTLSWRARVKDLKPGKQPWFDARILLEFKDKAGNKLANNPAPPYWRKDTNGWVERSVSFLVPEGAATLEFMPALFQAEAGTLDLDDVQLKPTDAAPLIEAAKVAAAAAAAKLETEVAAKQAKAKAQLERDGSLISNGTFEADKNSDAWPDQWGKVKTGGSWEAEAGNRFLRLKSTTPGETVLLYHNRFASADCSARAHLEAADQRSERWQGAAFRCPHHARIQGCGGEEARAETPAALHSRQLWMDREKDAVPCSRGCHHT